MKGRWCSNGSIGHPARGLPGSGLGLSIVQEVVHTMGGTVRLEEPSALGLQGDGLAVSIDLPNVDDGEP